MMDGVEPSDDPVPRIQRPRSADRYAPPIGPNRTEMYQAVGIDTALAL